MNLFKISITNAKLTRKLHVPVRNFFDGGFGFLKDTILPARDS